MTGSAGIKIVSSFVFACVSKRQVLSIARYRGVSFYNVLLSRINVITTVRGTVIIDLSCVLCNGLTYERIVITMETYA